MTEEPINKVKHLLADTAALRYKNYQTQIEKIRSDINKNRNGQISLTEITSDQERKQLRISREESSSISPLERINGVPNFQDISTIKKITKLADAVCRIVTESPYGSTSFGTGFLVAPNLILTNNHVLPDEMSAGSSIAQFNYEMSPEGVRSNSTHFKLRPDIFFLTSPFEKNQLKHSGLDFSLVAVEEVSRQNTNISEFGHARLDRGVGKILEGENCVIIQHPKGDYKKIVMKDIRMITLMDDFVLYESDTLPGSSGSMVVGLGTGEIIALHHSAVPRKDAKGNWLRKDGTPVTASTADQDIDWIGNEGVRISRILQVIREMEVSDHMTAIRDAYCQTLKDDSMSKISIGPEIPGRSSESGANDLINKNLDQDKIGYFEVQLVNNPILQEDWEQNISLLIPGVISCEALFEDFSDKNDPKFYYLKAKMGDSSWGMAEKIEELPHVVYCIPDEPIATDAMLSPENRPGKGQSPFESAVYTRGYAQNNETEFLNRWRYSRVLQPLLQIPDSELRKKSMRAWNHCAIKLMDKDGKYLTLGQEIINNLPGLKLVQLDTGYSHLSKIAGKVNFDLDYDFIDEDDTAEDELKRFGVKHPYHGARTASIAVGGAMKRDPFKQDGNPGVLSLVPNLRIDNDKTLQCKLIPYRIANSVILIGRNKHVLDAVNRAVSNNTDVMFMCMGSLPSPTLDKAARVAYENGIIWVCAGGNQVEIVVSPANYPGTISVAAINPDLEPWSGTSYGKMIDIAAPGEDVYVPFLDKHKNEIMVYGNGTSYATPHVASAAMLWKANFRKIIEEKYNEPWQIVEAFRYCLSFTATKKIDGWLNESNSGDNEWNYNDYGDGILNIDALLKLKKDDFPNPDDLRHAYRDQDWPSISNSPTIQAFRSLWQTFARKVNPWEPKPFESMASLTPRANEALSTIQRAVSLGNGSRFESSSLTNDMVALDVFRRLTEHYDRNTPHVKTEKKTNTTKN